MSSCTLLLGSAMLVNWGGFEPRGVDELSLNDWWTNEHLPERLNIPGFLRTRRYYTTDPDTNISQYLVCYEVESLDTLTSPIYMSALNNPTAGTAKCMPTMATMNRYACRVLHSAVRGDFSAQNSGFGGTIAHIVFTPPEQKENIRNSILDSKHIFGNAATFAVHLLELDTSATQAGSKSKSYESVRFQNRSTTESITESASATSRWIILVEFTEPLHAPFAQGPAVTKEIVQKLQAEGAQDIAWRVYGMLCFVTA